MAQYIGYKMKSRQSHTENGLSDFFPFLLPLSNYGTVWARRVTDFAPGEDLCVGLVCFPDNLNEGPNTH